MEDVVKATAEKILCEASFLIPLRNSLRSEAFGRLGGGVESDGGCDVEGVHQRLGTSTVVQAVHAGVSHAQFPRKLFACEIGVVGCGVV